MPDDTPKSDAISEPTDSTPSDSQAVASPTAQGAVDDAGLPMPGDPTARVNAESGELPPPPSFGRQMTQLVIIPAVIALSAISLFWFFGSLAATEDKLDDQLIHLRQGSGYGKRLPGGVQDPRYKNRCLAAFNISQSIDQLEEPDRRAWLNGELIDILKNNVHPEDKELITYLLIAIGRLGEARPAGEPTGLEIIVDHIEPDRGVTDSATDSSEQGAIDQVNQGVIMAILSWPDREAAAVTLPHLIDLTGYSNPAVREVAVSAVGVLGKADEQDVIDALFEALRSTDSMYRESRWNAAVALAAFNRDEGVTFVLETLLNREALAQLPQDPLKSTEKLMNGPSQDRVMLGTLAWAQRMTDEKVWQRVEELSEKDPSVSIRKAAIQLLEGRGK